MATKQKTFSSTSFALHWPGKVLFGAGQLQAVGKEALALGTHALLVTTRDLSALGVTDRLQMALESESLQVTRYEDVQPDPTCVAVDKAAQLARSAHCDLVVALGGGSAIDLAKAVTVAATHEGAIWDYVTYTGANARPIRAAVLPLIAIPTTAGTGSEVTQGAVLDNPATGMKAALLNPRVYPRVAVIDPELTYTMPPKITAMTGFDTLTHGIESFLNVERTNPASELFALEAVRLVAQHLPRVLANASDHQSRAKLSWAATCGGLCISLSNASVAHAMALPLGARIGTPHGLTLSRIQPVVLAHTWRAQTDRCAILAETAGATRVGMSVDGKAQAFVAWVATLAKQIGLAECWKTDGVGEAICDQLTKDVFAYMGRPIQQYRPVFSPEEIREMFGEVLLTSIH